MWWKPIPSSSLYGIWLSGNMKNLYSIAVSWSLRKSTTRRPEKIASICSKLLRNIFGHVTADRMWPKKGPFIICWNDDRWCLALLTSPGFLAGEVEKWPSQGAPGRRKDRRHHTWPRIKSHDFDRVENQDSGEILDGCFHTWWAIVSERGMSSPQSSWNSNLWPLKCWNRSKICKNIKQKEKL